MCTLVSRVLNVATLGFTVAFSGFLLLFVDWAAVRHGCPVEDECDFVKLAVYKCAPRQSFEAGVCVEENPTASVSLSRQSETCCRRAARLPLVIHHMATSQSFTPAARLCWWI